MDFCLALYFFLQESLFEAEKSPAFDDFGAFDIDIFASVLQELVDEAVDRLSGLNAD